MFKKPLRLLLDFLGLPGDVETVGRIIFALFGAGVVTGGWAAVAHYGPWAVFIGFGVFYFGVSAYLVTAAAAATLRLPNKLFVGDMGALQWRRPDEEKDNVGIQLLIGLNSMANFEIFFDVVVTEFRIGGVRGEPDKTRTVKGIIPPNGFANVSLATVVTKNNFEGGRLMMKVNYGREKDKYTHQMDTTMEFFPQAHLPADQQGFLHVLRNVVALEYRRLPDAKRS